MPTPDTTKKDTVPSKGGPLAVVVLAASIGALLLPSEGRKYTPYLDSAGIPTVCMGIIGKDVVWGKHYSPAECDQLESKYIIRMIRSMGACTPQMILGTMNRGEWLWYSHWNYNTGAFCNSGVHRKLVSGDRVGACKAMGQWTYITVKGKKVDCRHAGRLCPGIVKRRDMEVSGCLDAVNG